MRVCERERRGEGSEALPDGQLWRQLQPKSAPRLFTLVLGNALGGCKVCEITHQSLKECLISSK